MRLSLSLAPSPSLCFFWVIALCVFPWNKSCIRKSTCCPITGANFGRIKNRKWKRINHKILWANCFLCVSVSLIEWYEFKNGNDSAVSENSSISSDSRCIHALPFNYIHPKFYWKQSVMLMLIHIDFTMKAGQKMMRWYSFTTYAWFSFEFHMVNTLGDWTRIYIEQMHLETIRLNKISILHMSASHLICSKHFMQKTVSNQKIWVNKSTCCVKHSTRTACLS